MTILLFQFGFGGSLVQEDDSINKPRINRKMKVFMVNDILIQSVKI